MSMITCDCCLKLRRDVIPCGRDANGDPDAPDMCFLCRQEYSRNRVYSHKYNKYIDILLRDIELDEYYMSLSGGIL